MAEHSDETRRILEAIERDHVTPRPRWYWTLRKSALWIPGILTTLLGAYAIAGSIYSLTHIQWSTYVYTGQRTPPIFSATVVLLWLLSYAIFSIATVIAVRKSGVGYRHARRYILVGSALGSLVIGIVFYNTAEKISGATLSGYRYPITVAETRVWQNPGKGRIAGLLQPHTDPTQPLTLVDIEGHLWNIDTAQLMSPEMLTVADNGQTVRVVGINARHGSIVACYILPWDYPTTAIQKQPASPLEVLTDPFTPESKKTCREKFATLQAVP